MNTALPMQSVGTLDDLLERAARGAAAGHALEGVKNELTARRDDLYRKLLNAPADKVLEIRANLLAVENLAQSLLVKQAQGEAAHAALLQKGVVAGKGRSSRPPILRPEVHRRRSRAKTTTGQ